MVKHVYAEHSREIHVRAMAMVMERQNALGSPRAAIRRERLRGEPAFGPFFRAG